MRLVFDKQSSTSSLRQAQSSTSSVFDKLRLTPICPTEPVEVLYYCCHTEPVEVWTSRSVLKAKKPYFRT